MVRKTLLLALFLCLVATLGMAAPPAFCVRVFVADADGGHSMGSGTLVTPELIVTNWHVVKDARDGLPIKVLFPDWSVKAGYVVKIDRLWDIVAIAIPRVSVKPVTLGANPKEGDRLTVHGYGMGLPAQSTGTLDHFRAPSRAEMSNLDLIEIEGARVRQGDSGGPILNARGEYVGTLFGGGPGFTIGTNVERVKAILGALLDGKEWYDDYDLTMAHL